MYSVKQNSLLLSQIDFGNITRLQAFRAQYPVILRPKGAKVQLSKNKDFTHLRGTGTAEEEIPPQSYLLLWKKEIAELNKIHPDNTAYVYCDTKTEKTYDVEQINELLRVHKAMEIKQEVAWELDWFADVTNWPANLVSQPDQKDIKNFQSLIYTKRYDEILSGYDASPEELSRLCCTRWLSSDHMSWITKKLNGMQTDTLCIYLYFTRDIDHFVKKQTDSLRQKPTQFLFILNVRRSADGNVYLGSYEQPGNHWTVCHVDTRERIVTYCDSLAWSSPINLLDRIGKFIQVTYSEEVSLYTFVYAHDPSSGSHGHRCLSSCSPLYPLQRCGNVCGVVAMIVAAIACLATDFFRELTKKVDHAPQCSTFLRNPTKYSKYLRLVLMSWVANNEVLVSNVLPSFDAYTEQQSGTTSTATIRDEKGGRKEKNAENKRMEETKEDMNGKKEEKKKTKEIKEKKDGENGKKENKYEKRKIKSSDQCSKVAKPLSTKTGVNKWECQYCDLTCNDKSNLNRHIKRKHKDSQFQKNDEFNDVESGRRCKCNQCNYTCHRIVEFRKHLSKKHNVIFRTENIKLQNYKGA